MDLFNKHGWVLQKADAYYLVRNQRMRMVMSVEAFETMEISITPYPKFVELYSMGQLIMIIPE